MRDRRNRKAKQAGDKTVGTLTAAAGNESGGMLHPVLTRHNLAQPGHLSLQHKYLPPKILLYVCVYININHLHTQTCSQMLSRTMTSCKLWLLLAIPSLPTGQAIF